MNGAAAADHQLITEHNMNKNVYETTARNHNRIDHHSATTATTTTTTPTSTISSTDNNTSTTIGALPTTDAHFSATTNPGSDTTTTTTAALTSSTESKCGSAIIGDTTAASATTTTDQCATRPSGQRHQSSAPDATRTAPTAASSPSSTSPTPSSSTTLSSNSSSISSAATANNGKEFTSLVVRQPPPPTATTQRQLAIDSGSRTSNSSSSTGGVAHSDGFADDTTAIDQPAGNCRTEDGGGGDALLLDRKCVSGDSLETVNIEDRLIVSDISEVPAGDRPPPPLPPVNDPTSDSGAASEWMQSGCFVHQQHQTCGGNGGGSGGSDSWSRLNEQQLRDLVREMSKKMEYTERMNWLCLSSRPMGPPHRKTSLPNHKEVKARFLEICDETLSDEVKAALRLPTFDSYEWSDESVLHLMQTMFIDCGFVDKFQIPLPVLREWLYEVYKHYNLVPFHNFRHCFCVAQMMYSMAWHTNLMARLGDLEVLILIVSCICHDLDHPGYNNIYQINARTELALRYNDISPLENHHCSIAFRLLEHPDCNIFKNFSKDAFREIREGIIRCILATDMARHNDILVQFQEILPQFDYTNQAHINVFCMILIKVADISNESRPMNIAEPWLERLFQEFFAQSAIEKSEGLPVTPFMDPDKVSKPGSQVRFIGLVLLPLFESLGQLLPELNDLIIHPVRVAFDYYKCLNDTQVKPRKSHVDPDDLSDSGGNVSAGAGGSTGGSQIPRSQSGVSLRSRRSMPSQKSVSKNSVDEPMCISAELHDLPEGSESGDSETATEVEVAEKTSKFKINSEGTRTANTNNNISNKCTRKESRRKRPSMISEMYTSSFGGRSRGSYGNIHGHNHSGRCHFGSSRALSLDQYSRRLSDGVQTIVSDENSIRFNRQHRSLDNEGQLSDKFASSDSYGNGGSGSGVNKVTPLGSGGIHSKSSSSGSASGKSTKLTAAKNGATRSFMSTLRQLKESFHFSFEKDLKKRVAGQNIVACCNSTATTGKNNNPEFMKPSSGFCCGAVAGGPTTMPGAYAKDEITPHATRTRACSLDVPARMWYHGSPGGDGDSRKSSHDDNHSSRTNSDPANNRSNDGDGNRSDGTTSI